MDEPHFGSADVPTKIENVRTVEDSKKSGSGVNDVYKLKVFWFEALDTFLHPVVESRKKKSK